MASYRMYFFSWSGAIHGRDDFEAEGDGAAIVLAEQLCEACSDVVEWFELWQGSRMAHNSFDQPPRANAAAQITLRMQKSLIRREEAICNSHWRIARSKRLLQRIRVLENELRWRSL